MNKTHRRARAFLRILARQAPPPELFWREAEMMLSQLGYSPEEVEEILRAMEERSDARERRLLN